MKKIKVLEVLPCLTMSNGVAAYISNYFINQTNKELFDVYFLVFTPSVCDRHNEILENNGKIVEMYMEKNVFKYLKKLNKFLKKEKFDIIHCHAPNYGALIMPLAKKNKIPVRITHSHVNKSGETFLKNIRNNIMSKICVSCSNYYFACSSLAGEWLFKKKKFYVVKNAINIEKYKFSSIDRKKIRNELNISKKFVIGEFGRLCNQKNQLFTIDIFYEFLKLNNNSVLLLAGDGPLENEIIKKISLLGIKDKVILLGSIKNLSPYYSALDFFLLPSTYEGLGIVLIEAQANGLNCLASSQVIPNDAKVSDLLSFEYLSKAPSSWANKITNAKRKNVIKDIQMSGYDIFKEANKLFEIYSQLLDNEKKGNK